MIDLSKFAYRYPDNITQEELVAEYNKEQEQIKDFWNHIESEAIKEAKQEIDALRQMNYD